MNDELRTEILARLTALPANQIFSLHDLLLDKWVEIGNGNERRKLGDRFSVAVRNGEYPQCERIGLLGNDRDVKYRRLP